MFPCMQCQSTAEDSISGETVRDLYLQCQSTAEDSISGETVRNLYLQCQSTAEGRECETLPCSVSEDS